MIGKGIDNSTPAVADNGGVYTVVTTRWNANIVEGLLTGALNALGVAGITGEQVRVATLVIPGV